jgi:hypothetical protein
MKKAYIFLIVGTAIAFFVHQWDWFSSSDFRVGFLKDSIAYDGVQFQKEINLWMKDYSTVLATRVGELYSPTVQIIYLPFFLLGLSKFIFIFHLSLLALTFKIYEKLYKNVSSTYFFACFAVLANPYILISVFGPSKEILLTFFSALIFQILLKKNSPLKWIFLAIALILAAGIRPPFVMAFLMWMGLKKFLKPTSLFQYLGIYIGIGLLLNLFYDAARTFKPDVRENPDNEIEGSRVGEIARLSKDSALSPISFALYVLRFALTPIIHIIRPFGLSPDGQVSVMFLSFMVFGLIQFMSIFVLILRNSEALQNKDEYTVSDQMAQIYMSGLTTTAIAQIIHPRYMMPYTPFAIAAIGSLTPKNKQLVFKVFAGLVIVRVIFFAAFPVAEMNTPLVNTYDIREPPEFLFHLK